MLHKCSLRRLGYVLCVDCVFIIIYLNLLVWKPVIEPVFGWERFLTDDPKNLMRSMQFARVPIITGIDEYGITGQAIASLKASLFYHFNLIYFLWISNVDER